MVGHIGADWQGILARNHAFSKILNESLNSGVSSSACTWRSKRLAYICVRKTSCHKSLVAGFADQWMRVIYKRIQIVRSSCQSTCIPDALRVLWRSFLSMWVRGCERIFLKGLRVTATELFAANVPFKIITDSMAAWTMKTHRVDAILVGKSWSFGLILDG